MEDSLGKNDIQNMCLFRFEEFAKCRRRDNVDAESGQTSCGTIAINGILSNGLMN